MAFWNDVKKAASGAMNSVSAELKKYQNKDVLDAMVGASVMVAAADGNIDASEKTKLLGYLKVSELTKVYPTDQVIDVFQKHSERFDFGVDIGKAEALRIIGRHRSNPDVARTIMRTVIMIANADGNFDANEKRVIQEIAKELGQNAADFGI